MNKKVPEITESVEDLKAFLPQTKKRQEYQRLSTLYPLKSKQAKNRVQVAALLGVDRISIGHWLASYETGELERLLERGYAPGCLPTLTEEQHSGVYCRDLWHRDELQDGLCDSS